MTAPIDALSADALVSDEEEDAPVDVWSLDELDRDFAKLIWQLAEVES